MEPKTLPKSNFEAIFWPVFSCWKFASFFTRFTVVFSLLEPLIFMLPSRRNANFHKIVFFEKHAKNHRKNLSKSLPKPPEIDSKSKKIEENRSKNASWRKMRPKIEKMRKNCEKVAQDPPKRTRFKTPTGYAMPCLESDRTKIGPLTPNI